MGDNQRLGVLEFFSSVKLNVIGLVPNVISYSTGIGG